MEHAMELAGFFAAHAVWSVSDGATLIPIFGYEDRSGKRQMVRLASDHLEEAVARGRDRLSRNPDHALRAVLIYDGFITLPSGKTDALVVAVRDFTLGSSEVTMAIPYRPGSDAKGFAVHRPKFLGYQGQQPDYQKLGEALWRGIAMHEKGAAAWNQHLDESK